MVFFVNLCVLGVFVVPLFALIVDSPYHFLSLNNGACKKPNLLISVLNMNFILKVLITAVNAFALAYILPGIDIKDFLTAIIVALVLSVLDAVVKPVLVLFTLPATIFTLGLFLFVINAIIILIDAYFVGGFEIATPKFWNALLFSILLSIANSVVHKLVLKDRKKED